MDQRHGWSREGSMEGAGEGPGSMDGAWWGSRGGSMRVSREQECEQGAWGSRRGSIPTCESAYELYVSHLLSFSSHTIHTHISSYLKCSIERIIVVKVRGPNMKTKYGAVQKNDIFTYEIMFRKMGEGGFKNVDSSHNILLLFIVVIFLQNQHFLVL